MSPAAGRGGWALAATPPRAHRAPGPPFGEGSRRLWGINGLYSAAPAPRCGCCARPQPVAVTRKSDSTRRLGGVFVVKRLLLKSRLFKLTDFMIYLWGGK